MILQASVKFRHHFISLRIRKSTVAKRRVTVAVLTQTKTEIKEQALEPYLKFIPRLGSELKLHGIFVKPVEWYPSFLESSRSSNWRPNWDVTLCMCAWDYSSSVSRRKEFLSYLNLCPNVVNPIQIIQANSSKQYLLDLYSAGVANVIPTLPLENNSFFPTNLQTDIVVKPLVGGSSRAVQRAAHSELQNITESLLRSSNEKWIVQPFQKQIQDGEFGYIFVRDQFLLAVKKKVNQGFRASANVAGVTNELCENVKDNEILQAREFIHNFLHLYNLQSNPYLYSRVDCVKKGDNLLLMEIEMVEPYLYNDYSKQDYVTKELAKGILDFINRPSLRNF